MKIEDLSLAEIVTAKPQAAAVLEAFHLDYCCRGKQKLSDAVVDSNKLSSLVNVLTLLYAEPVNQEMDFNNMPLDKLVDYILNVHHKYVKENIPVIQQHLEKVLSKHGDRNPEMSGIKDLFEEEAIELSSHMMKEELILFPRIKNMEVKMQDSDATMDFSIENPIRIMEREHEVAGDLMEEIRVKSNNYTAPEGACMTHRLCLEELKMFEEDLHKHVHLENNILFPRSIAKEMIIKNRQR